LPDAITSHSSIKQERTCSIRAGGRRRGRLWRPVLGVGRGHRQSQHNDDCYSRHAVRLPSSVQCRRGSGRQDVCGGPRWSGRWPRKSSTHPASFDQAPTRPRN